MRRVRCEACAARPSRYHAENAARIRLTELSELYDRDFVLWTEEQTASLRRAKDSNLPLDWENLA